MTRHYCTYFDKNYFVKALALIHSLHEREKEPFVLYAVCLDEISRVLLEKFNLPHVITVPLHAVERRNAGLAEARRSRSLVEYYWTLTPTVIHWLFEQNPSIQALTYVDADMYFYSSPDPIFREFEGHSVVIHEHRFPPEFKYLEVHGKYNVGLLCFRRDSAGMEVLSWWRDRCIEWCHARLEDGKFGDQLYLNDWPERFAGVKVLEHVGAGVAPWNHNQYSFEADPAGGVLVDGLPLVFYHFHSFTFVMPGVVIPAKFAQYNPMPHAIVELCVLPYVERLHGLLAAVQQLLPSFGFGTTDMNILNERHTLVVRKELAPGIETAFANCGKTARSQPLADNWLTFNSL